MEIYNSTTQSPPFDITERPPFFNWSDPSWCFIIGSRVIIIGFLLSCMIVWALFICSLLLGERLGWCSKGTLETFLSFFAESPKSKGELQQTYQSNLLAAPLKSNMTWLKGPKVDQLPNLFITPKTVGTLEELLIMP